VDDGLAYPVRAQLPADPIHAPIFTRGADRRVRCRLSKAEQRQRDRERYQRDRAAHCVHGAAAPLGRDPDVTDDAELLRAELLQHARWPELEVRIGAPGAGAEVHPT
jgi:hypothetical protein